MSAHAWHPSRGSQSPRRPAVPNAPFDYPVDELLLDERPVISTHRADCCVAKAAYRVVLPPTATRERPAVLLLCGHHFHASRSSLREKCASVFDANHRLIAAVN